MAEKSLFWFTDGFDGAIGDGAAPYTEEEFRGYNSSLFGEGVIADAGNELAVTGTATPLAVNTGRAQVSGFHYFNTASVDLTVTTPAVGTTGGRVALVADWTTATVRLAIKLNTDGNAAIPAMTQTPGTLYEITLASFTVTTAGVIAVTDTRVFAPSPLARQISQRQGGSATNWQTGGNINYTVPVPRMAAGREVTNIGGVRAVTFPTAFAYPPLIFTQTSSGTVYCTVTDITASSCTLNTVLADDSPLGLAEVSWLAIGEV
jgi:hypothetical protein